MAASSYATAVEYRPDIDGLRAIAVLLVLGFHAFPSWLEAGFIGVDIFFVISGFLISSIIFKSLDANSFSFRSFYARRIQRIFPTLALVLTACFAFGWFTLLTDEYKQLSQHIAGGAGFIANVLLWLESGYFDTSADTKPLLHLWSLGIEEQFYAIWPLVVWGAWRKKSNVPSLILLAMGLSLLLNLIGIQRHQSACFYLPHTRFWELLVGSLLAAMQRDKRRLPGQALARAWERLGALLGTARQRNLRALLGLVLLISAVLLIKRDTAFPGAWALLPTLSAALLISAGSASWFNRHVLSNKALVWIGLISYPLYLWHWPLLSFARIINGRELLPQESLCLVLAAFALAWLSAQLLERPIRFGRLKGRKAVWVLSGTMVGLALVGITGSLLQGLPNREVVRSNPSPDSGSDGGDGGYTIEGCGIASPEERKIIRDCLRDKRETPRYALIGDSKASAIFGGLVRTSSPGGRWLMIGGNNNYNSPVPVLSEDAIYAEYQKPLQIVLQAITANPEISMVLIVTATRKLFHLKNDYSIEDLPTSPNFALALAGLSQVVSMLVKAGKKVVLMIDNPTLPGPKDCSERTTSLAFVNAITKRDNPACRLQLARHLELAQQYRRLLASIAADFPGEVRVFDPTKHLCDLAHSLCLPYKDGHRLYAYSDHISDYAAGLIGTDLNAFLATF